MWRVIGSSVTGSSHTAECSVCQDSHARKIVSHRANQVLLLACSDGAGSAPKSNVGSRVACDEAIVAAEDIFCCCDASSWDREALLTIARRVHNALLRTATDNQHSIEELHCTLLFAAIAADRAAFFQIGDGAIVVLTQAVYTPVFWPQSGEFAGTTYFITFADFERYLECQFIEESIGDVALFTDGIERLVLDFRGKNAHQPFFSQMMDRLLMSTVPERLEVVLGQYLDSPAVNDRTDDDKTLILATRRDCRASNPDGGGQTSSPAVDADA